MPYFGPRNSPIILKYSIITRFSGQSGGENKEDRILRAKNALFGTPKFPNYFEMLHNNPIFGPNGGGKLGGSYFESQKYPDLGPGIPPLFRNAP